MTREEIVNEYFTEHRYDILLNPYAGLLDFAKYLDEHSELPEGLEEAAWKYAPDLPSYNIGGGYLPPQSRCDLRTAFKDGAEWQKVKMMEKAVEGVVQDDGQFIKFGDGRYIDLDPSLQLNPVWKLNDGQKVKLIIIPEDENVD